MTKISNLDINTAGIIDCSIGSITWGDDRRSLDINLAWSGGVEFGPKYDSFNLVLSFVDQVYICINYGAHDTDPVGIGRVHVDRQGEVHVIRIKNYNDEITLIEAICNDVDLICYNG